MTGPVEPSRPEREPEGSDAVEGGATAPEPPLPIERPASPSGERPSGTGWTAAPRPAGLTPGSVPGVGPRTESVRLGPAGSGSGPRPPAPTTSSSPSTSPGPAGTGPTSGPPPLRSPGPPPASSPVRPAVPTGVPPRTAPLPPPRDTGATTALPGPERAGSLASETVVPARPPRRPPPRPGRPGGAVTARGRRARLSVKRLDPWSVFVTSLVLSLMLGVATIVASFLVYGVIDAMGVPASINDNIGDITKQGDVITQWRFVGFAALVSAGNVVFLTALATVGSMLYNLVATFTGGLEVTLSEKE